MRLADVAVELRPRDAWEAVDLGQAMWRAWWRRLHVAWFVTFVPLAVGLAFALQGRLGVALFVLWWLLPLVERGPLHVLGRSVFGVNTPFTQLLTDIPKLWSRRALWRLTVARLSPWRGFVAPIAVLEHQAGSAARARGRVLMAAGNESSVALALSFVALAIQFGVAVALVSLLETFLPTAQSEQLYASFSSGLQVDGETMWPSVLLYAIGCIAMSVVGPLHTASSFALYLNRRIFLEGWDVDVAFRALAQRLTAAARRAAIVGLLFVGAFFTLSPPSRAQVEQSEVQPQAAAEEILSRPEFTTSRTERQRKRVPRDARGSGPNFLAPIARIVIVVAAVVALVYLLALLLKWRPSGKSGAGGKAQPPPPVEVAGLDVRPESLPDDPAAAALELWRRGAARESLGLLYRAAIARLARSYLVPIVDGDTEGQCLRRVIASGERAPGSTFAALTRAWQRCAYGRELPVDAEFGVLVDEFRRDFGGAQ